MANLFATIASYILELLLVPFFVAVGVPTLVLIVLFAFMLTELTTKGLLGILAAAPPHLTAPLTLMSPARPVIVLLLEIFLSALLTDLLIVLNPESTVLQLCDSLFHLVTLHLKLLGQFNLPL